MLGQAPRLRIPRRVAGLSEIDLSGRVCVVTGASAGIGLETAYRLASWGARVTLVGRNPEKTRAAGQAVKEATGNPEVNALVADFSSLDEVRNLADRLLALLPEIHVLVNNAGLWLPERQVSADGYEMTFAVNHLATFLLTQLLEPRLRESAPGRVVTVSSRLDTKDRELFFDDLDITHRRYTGLGAYRQSKLANVLFSNELASRLGESGVTSNSVHPGDVATSVARGSKLLDWGSRWLGPRWLLTPEEGARTTIFAASHPSLNAVSGRYFADQREAVPNPTALDPAVARKLWARSEDLVAG